MRDLLQVSAHDLGLIFGGILSGFIAGIVVSRPLTTRLGPRYTLLIGLSVVLVFAAVTAAAMAGFLQMAAGAAFGILASMSYDGTVWPMITLQLGCAVTAVGSAWLREGRKQTAAAV